MDLSSYLQQDVATSSNITPLTRKRKHEEENDSSEILPKRICYSPPTGRQNWSIPESILYYMIKNPCSPQVYQKMIFSCKYFFDINPIILCSTLTYIRRSQEGTDLMQIEQDGEEKIMDLNSARLWLTDVIDLHTGNIEQDVISHLIPKIYKCDSKIVNLYNQNITFDEYKLLASNARRLHFKHVTVKYDDGVIVPLEKLLEAAVNVKEFIFRLFNNDPSVSSETVKKLLMIPHFSTLNQFYMTHVPESFDMDALFNHIKTNKTTKFALAYCSPLSDEYRRRLEAIVDEILSIEEHEYQPPLIAFREIDPEKYRKLYDISLPF